MNLNKNSAGSATLPAGKKRFERNIYKNHNIILHMVFILLCIIFVAPVLLTVIISFTDEAVIALEGYSFFPSKWSLDGYKYALQSANIYNAYKITIIVATVGTICSVLIMTLYAYPLSRKDFKYRTFFTFFAYFSGFLSGGLVPWYITCTQILGIGNTLWALILPPMINTSYIIILRTFISTNVPKELIEAAKIDGAGEHRIFWTLVMPLSKPGLATIGLFMLLTYWNDYYQPMMLITDESLFNLQYCLQVMFTTIEVLLSGAMGADATVSIADLPKEGTRMAMCVLAMGPILVVYPFFQKYFVKGLTIGAVKG